MYVIRDRTHEQLSKAFRMFSEAGNFSDYFTDHLAKRIILSGSANKAILQQKLAKGVYSYVLLTSNVSLLKDPDFQGLVRGLEHKTSILQQVLNQAR